MHLRLAYMYPAEMNTYGDRGNVIALTQRAAWRGITVETVPITPGNRYDWASFDLAFFGGGQDSGQSQIADDLMQQQADGIRQAVEHGLVLLAICGGYQMLGHYFRTHTGEKLPGVGVFDIHTVGGKQRLIGNIVVEATLPGLDSNGGQSVRLVGFENHSGRTYHGSRARSLGRVLTGYGDNGEDGIGGTVQHNAIGCYLHGSLLPKNPQLTDYMLTHAVRRHQPAATLPPLDDTLELQAQRSMVARLLR